MQESKARSAAKPRTEAIDPKTGMAAAARVGVEIEEIVRQLAETIQKEANVNAVFGEVRTLNHKTVIPVAQVSISLGGGGGGGGGLSKNGDDKKRRIIPVGLGGGGSVDIKVSPLGFISEKDDEAQFTAITHEDEGLVGRIEHLVRTLQRKAD